MTTTPESTAASPWRLVPKLVPGWAKLAWLAVMQDGVRHVEVYHGSHVVAGSQWCAECVWDGPFAQGDFDQTDLVIGTGVRCRDTGLVFVPSGHSMERLWYCRRSTGWVVSNSLPSLLAFAGLKLLEDHNYDQDISTVYGVTPPVKSMPADGAEISLVWCDNLFYNGQDLAPIAKPDSTPRFACFDDYFNFLADAAKRLGGNMADPARPEQVVPVATISSGYDSPAAAVVARFAGCTQAVTIRDSTSMWRGPDSGETIAARLGMSCRVYPRTALRYPEEEAVWAAANRSGLLNWAQFDLPQPLSLLFTGCFGDALWDRTPHGTGNSLSLFSRLVLGMGEWRLLQGMLHGPVPFWGIRRIGEIRAITSSAEMQPWRLQSRYDRPIARRIVEQAGVPRGAFAVRKKDTSTDVHFRWPFSPECRGSFAEFARRRSLHVPWPVTLKVLRSLAIGETLLSSLTMPFHVDPRLVRRFELQATNLLFHWANAELADRYARAMRAAELDIPPVYGLRPV